MKDTFSTINELILAHENGTAARTYAKFIWRWQARSYMRAGHRIVHTRYAPFLKCRAEKTSPIPLDPTIVAMLGYFEMPSVPASPLLSGTSGAGRKFTGMQPANPDLQTSTAVGGA